MNPRRKKWHAAQKKLALKPTTLKEIVEEVVELEELLVPVVEEVEVPKPAPNRRRRRTLTTE